MIEDFTHVLPEDKPIRQQFKSNGLCVYDLAEANRQAKYYAQLRERITQAETAAKNAMQAKLSTN